MSAQGNTDLVRRAVEQIWNRGEIAMANVLFAPRYVNHGGLIPDLVCGPEAIARPLSAGSKERSQ